MPDLMAQLGQIDQITDEFFDPLTPVVEAATLDKLRAYFKMRLWSLTLIVIRGMSAQTMQVVDAVVTQQSEARRN